MTEPLYLKDHYLKEFEAVVTEVLEGYHLVLNKSSFFPQGGGQPNDMGKIIKLTDNKEFNVLNVRKESGKTIHDIDKEGLKTGDKIKGIIDWERRYKLMRSHTAAHILSEVIYKDTNTLITGNQLDTDKVRIDFSLQDFNKEKMQEYIESANKIIEQDLPIIIEFTTREEALKIPQISKLAIGLPESIKEVRIVKIGSFDTQADGGTHVNSTKEIGKIEFLKAENKGKNNRRLYFKITKIY